MPDGQGEQTRLVPSRPFETKPGRQMQMELAEKLYELAGHAVQLVELCAEKDPEPHAIGAAPAPAHAMPAGQATVLLVAADAQNTPAEHRVQVPLLASEYEPAAHANGAVPLGQAKPAGQTTELFVAAVKQRIPVEHGRQVEAVVPPGEYVPARQIVGDRPFPGHARPAGQGTVLDVASDGQ